MSSTKIVIIVLVLIGLLFVIFIARGALRGEPDKPATDQTAAKNTQPPNWTKTIEGLFSSLKPKRALGKKVYTLNSDQPVQLTIKADDKQPFRTAKFHLPNGSAGAKIEYSDDTPVQSKDLEKLKKQEFSLPADFNPKHPQADRSRGSIVALKGGGRVTITCNLNSTCQVEVE